MDFKLQSIQLIRLNEGKESEQANECNLSTLTNF